MFQDIEPHRLFNQYTHRRPASESDLLIVYQKGRVLLRKAQEASSVAPTTPQKENHLPRCGDFPELAREYGNLQFLIEVDATAFYLWQGEVEEASGEAAMNADQTLSKDEMGLPGADETQSGEESVFPGILRFSNDRFSFEPMSVLRRMKPQEIAYGAVTACHLAVWYDQNRYCGRCAHPMKPDEKERAMRCEHCGNIVYPRISPGVIVRVTDGDRILLTKYAGREFTNYALVAGFTEIGETLEETVRREVREEVGLEVKNIRYYTNQPWGFSQSLLVGFYAELDGDGSITLEEEELSTGVWMTREEMPSRADDISMTARMMENFRLGLD